MIKGKPLLPFVDTASCDSLWLYADHTNWSSEIIQPLNLTLHPFIRGASY